MSRSGRQDFRHERRNHEAVCRRPRIPQRRAWHWFREEGVDGSCLLRTGSRCDDARQTGVQSPWTFESGQDLSDATWLHGSRKTHHDQYRGNWKTGRRSIARRSGEERALTHALTIDGLSPGKVLQPGSVEELAQIISAEKGSVLPLGARTQTDFGNPLRRADCAIDVSRLRRITEYNPADLTIHVEAGVTLGQLQQALLENNQFLPLDPWNGPQATIGGIAAANAQGPLRATGTIRDWIIGMKVVEVTGRVSKAGGRVVKNVTGYDLQKLYGGSLGTLAIIAEISLKLRAKFGRTATAIVQTGDTDAAAELVRSIRTSALQPI